jgi:hypothetical protein
MARVGRAVLGLVLLPLAVVTPAYAAPAAGPPVSDVRELSRNKFTLDGRQLPERPRFQPSPRTRAAGEATPAVGTVRQWLGLDDVDGKFYRKDYTLRGVGDHIEVWVAKDLAFPAGDCRGAAATVVTDAQVRGFVREFDGNIYPKETTAFSTPPDRDGSKPVLQGDFGGDGDKTVTLVDNVRDDNFFHFPDSATYVAGFFSAQLNELLDRNVMTVDAYDWVHRSGATPPDAPTDDLCTSRPARPRMYEGTFAHEWQHLLQYYTDPVEETWVNEGLSDYAQTLVGYVDGTATVYHPGADSHLSCYQGFGTVKTRFNTNPRACGGPQNSLNLWDEGEPADVLADYGNAYEFMLYLHDRFGPSALSRLHRDGIHHGLAGVAAALPGTDLYGLIHDFQTMTLVDKIVQDGRMSGIDAGRVTAASLRSTVNLANPAGYDTPGAAPNGADFVRLRDRDGNHLRGRDLRTVVFAGAKSLPARPLEWSVRDGALFSGNDAKLDAADEDPVRTGGRLRLRLRDRLDRRRQDLCARRGGRDGGRAAGRGDHRQFGGARGTHLGPFGVRGKEGPAGFPVCHRRFGERGRLVDRRRHGRWPQSERRLQPAWLPVAHPDRADPGAQLGRAAGRAGRAPGPAGAGHGVRAAAGLRQDRRDRRLRRPDREDHPVRALHADGQRVSSAGFVTSGNGPGRPNQWPCP